MPTHGPTPGTDGQPSPSGLEELVDAMLDDGKAYLHARQEQLKLDIYGKAGAVAGGAAIGVVAVVALSLCLVFASLALAVWLGTLLGGLAWGLLLVAGAYLFFFLLVYFLARTRIQETIQLYVINLLRDGRG
ncbi:MAG: phage holin family protein [Flavobacteriales bacterium]|nr:phage holin family protein [Flavobacteriales bacterium]MBP9080489.1 phage holin family protein [Flavobacteriales bacterium]